MNDKIEKLKFAINQILLICNITEGQFNVQFNVEGMKKWARVVQGLIDSGYDMDKLWEEQEMLYTSSYTLRAAFAEMYCYNPINAIANTPPISPKRFEHMCKLFSKDVVPFLSYEEFYYALGLLDDMDVRRVFSRSKTNNNSVIYNAFIAKNKAVFMETVKSLETTRFYPALYAALFYSKDFIPLLKTYFDKLAENESNKYEYMSILYTIAPSSTGYLPYYYRYKQEKEKNLDDFLVDTRSIAEDYLGQLHYGILSIMEDEGIDTYLKSEMQNLYNERKFVFDAISPKEIGVSFDDSPEIERCIAAVSKGILYCIQEKLKIEIEKEREEREREEKEREEQLVALESKESKNEEDEQCDINPLGISSLIRTELIGWIQLQENEGRNVPLNKIYRYVLDCLYKLLTGGVVGAISVGEKINCSKEDFLFLLGGSLEKDEESKVNETPTIIWNGEARDMVAFIYAYCGYLSNTQYNLNPSPYKNALGFMCGKTGKRYEKLSGNIRKKEKAYIQAISDWNNRIIDCCNYAKNTFYTRK